MEKREKRPFDRIHQFGAPMPPNFKKKLLPDCVVKYITGARIAKPYRAKPDLVCLEWNNEQEVLHLEDFEIVEKIAKEVFAEQIDAKRLMPSIHTLPTGLMLRKHASEKLDRLIDGIVQDKKKVIFIKDRSGCGYWRFVVPTRYMDHSKYYVDIAEIEVIYDYLLEYDTIVVQRLHTWEEYYTICRLKNQGKKVIYDIDDDIFNIPEDNPAYRVIRADQYEAARAMMEVCDGVVTTTEKLKEKLGMPDKTIIIPNAIDIDDGYQAEHTPSEDGFRRILWMGSATHEKDWHECIEAVDKLFQDPNYSDVRLTIIGFLPECVRECFNTKNWWDNRIEYQKLNRIETYISTTKKLKGEVAIAPLQNTSFNAGKSNLKWLEYTACGFPTVASNTSPYKESIKQGESGFLAQGTAEWLNCLKKLLDNPQLRVDILYGALVSLEQNFDVKEVVKEWERVIFG